MNHLNKLVGKIITDIQFLTGQYFPLSRANEEIADSQNVPEIWIQMEDYSLTISNPISLFGQINDLKELIGRKIINVIDDDEQATFYIDENIHLQVNLRQEFYVGPEAMSLHGPDNLIVVWN